MQNSYFVIISRTISMSRLNYVIFADYVPKLFPVGELEANTSNCDWEIRFRLGDLVLLHGIAPGK